MRKIINHLKPFLTYMGERTLEMKAFTYQR